MSYGIFARVCVFFRVSVPLVLLVVGSAKASQRPRTLKVPHWPGDWTKISKAHPSLVMRLTLPLPSEYNYLTPTYQQVLEEYVKGGGRDELGTLKNDLGRHELLAGAHDPEKRMNLEKKLATWVRLRLLVNAVRSDAGVSDKKLLTYRQIDISKMDVDYVFDKAEDVILDSSMSTSAAIKEAVKQYKIHLIIPALAVESVLLKLATAYKRDAGLSASVCGFRVNVVGDPEKTTTIVICINEGTQAAEYALNFIYRLFADLKGPKLAYQPPYSEKITDFLYVMQGNISDKRPWAAHDRNFPGTRLFSEFPYEDERMIYYSPMITGSHQNYNLHQLQPLTSGIPGIPEIQEALPPAIQWPARAQRIQAAYPRLAARLMSPLPPRFRGLTPQYQQELERFLEEPGTPGRLDDIFMKQAEEFITQYKEGMPVAPGVGGALTGHEAEDMVAEWVRLRLLVCAVNSYGGNMADNLKPHMYSKLRMMEIGYISSDTNDPQFAANQYKIHLMPPDDKVEDVVLRLAWQYKNNKQLQDAAQGFKVTCLPNRIEQAHRVAKIVIYVEGGRDAAQSVLDTMYDIFSDMHSYGRGYVPRFNQQVTNFLFFAQGHGDNKAKWLRSYDEPNIFAKVPQKTFESSSLEELRERSVGREFPYSRFPYEDKNMIYYEPNVTGELQEYHLNDPKRNRPQTPAAPYPSSANIYPVR